MFKFGKTPQKPSPVIREAEISRLPVASELRNILANAQRNWQKSIELPFCVADSPLKLTLVVKCERQGAKIAYWTLYRTDVPGSPTLWTQNTADVDLVQNLIELGCSTAAETPASGYVPGTAAETVAPATATSSPEDGKLSRNSYLAQLEASGKYQEPASRAGASAPAPEGREAPRTDESPASRGSSDDSSVAPLPESTSPNKTSPAGKVPVDTTGGIGDKCVPAEQQSFNATVNFDQAVAQSKERKQQALTAAVLKLSAGNISGCKPEIIEAVRLVMNPFDTGTASSTVADKIDRDLQALITKFGDGAVSTSLSETFTALLKSKPAPSDSEIAEVTSKWFW